MITGRAINVSPRPADMQEALPHAANRVRLAKSEQADARIAVMRAKDALKTAEAHMQRCDEAAAQAITRLARLAETGRCDAYCQVHDLFYTFAPQVPRRANGTVDHYNPPETMWTHGAPPCPMCAEQLSEKGVIAKSRENWML